MAMDPRKGLKRYGMRSYIVKGPKAVIVIERERPWRFSIRHETMPPGFFMEKFKRLGKARAAAETYAGCVT
jgi:hypothetical protein